MFRENRFVGLIILAYRQGAKSRIAGYLMKGPWAKRRKVDLCEPVSDCNKYIPLLFHKKEFDEAKTCNVRPRRVF